MGIPLWQPDPPPAASQQPEAARSDRLPTRRSAGAASSSWLTAEPGFGPTATMMLAPTTLASLTSLANVDRGAPLGLARPPVPRPAPPPASVSGWDANDLGLEPPPLLMDSDDDMDDLPSLLSDSPASTSGLDDLDLYCLPDPLRATIEQSSQQRLTLARQAPSPNLPASFVLRGGPRSERFRRPAPPAPQNRVTAPSSSPALPLDAELMGLAGRVAGLLRLHREQLDAAGPQVQAGLQQVANQLQGLATTLRAGPPPLI